MAINSPMSQWTTINTMLNTPSSAHSGLPELGSSFSPSTASSSFLATPENSHAHILQKGFSTASSSNGTTGAPSSYSASPMPQHNLPPILPQLQSMPQSSFTQPFHNNQNMNNNMVSSPPVPHQTSLPQACGFAFATPTFVQDQSVYQSQLSQQHQQQQSQQPGAQYQQQTQAQSQQSPASAGQQGDLQHAAYAISPPITTTELSFPTELFFDNLCM